MPDIVHLTIDGKAVEAPAGALLIEVARKAGIEIPAFCYYEGLALQAACRMCLVEVEKAPKLLAGCTLPVAEGMVVRTESPQVAQARKAMLEFLLTNHPLDCPVCDKGGECELQDMVFRYGAGESRFSENKVHTEEKQFSPVVFFDAPRCILCYRCVRICNEGMGVGALGVVNRGVLSEIAPSHGDHLECDECGACIDICPVGALTSGTYRYKTRPWEMNHVGTVCSHCSNGCKTTLGVRNNRIVRGNNRDRGGINGEFLCIKGRYAFDYTAHAERLETPLVKVNGKFEEVSWARALKVVAARFGEVKSSGGTFGVIGSNHTTNEENYCLQKFARQGLGTANIDHRRTGDVPTLLDAIAGKANAGLAAIGDLYTAKAVLVVGVDSAQQQPLVHFRIRENWRHHGAHVYAVTRGPVREDKISARSIRVERGQELGGVEQLREALAAEPELVIVFGEAIRGDAVRKLVAFGESLAKPVKYICAVDESNSRGAADMGLMPDMLPGYQPAPVKGLGLDAMLDASLDVLWVIGENPLEGRAGKCGFLVVQDLFLTATAEAADVVLPSFSLYEKNGTVTNLCGEVQKLQQAVKFMGAKPDLEIFSLIAREMGVDCGPVRPDLVLDEIRKSVRGYNVSLPVIATGGAVQVAQALVPATPGSIPAQAPEQVRSSGDTLFTSGYLGRYSRILGAVLEAPGGLFRSVSPNVENPYPAASSAEARPHAAPKTHSEPAPPLPLGSGSPQRAEPRP